jgi:hypothetical protein
LCLRLCFPLRPATSEIASWLPSSPGPSSTSYLYGLPRVSPPQHSTPREHLASAPSLLRATFPAPQKPQGAVNPRSAPNTAHKRYLLDFAHERMAHLPAAFYRRFRPLSSAGVDPGFVHLFCKGLLLRLRSHRKELQVLVRVWRTFGVVGQQ